MKFGKDYYFCGAESNYINYQNRSYIKLSRDITKILKLKKNDNVLDYGCAMGLLVKELKNKCHIHGTDISDWVIDYGIKKFGLKTYLYKYDKSLLETPNLDHVIMLDVLEHCNNKELNDIFTRLKYNKKVKLIVRLPVSLKEGDNFFLELSRKDKTHIQVHCKNWWKKFFKNKGFNKIKPIIEPKIYDTPGVLAWKVER